MKFKPGDRVVCVGGFILDGDMVGHCPVVGEEYIVEKVVNGLLLFRGYKTSNTAGRPVGFHESGFKSATHVENPTEVIGEENLKEFVELINLY